MTYNSSSALNSRRITASSGTRKFILLILVNVCIIMILTGWYYLKRDVPLDLYYIEHQSASDNVTKLISTYTTVISAFLDPRDVSHVLVLATIHERLLIFPIICILHCESGISYRVRAKPPPNLTYWKMNFSGRFIQCPILPATPIASVSIFFNPFNELQSNSVPVEEIPSSPPKEPSIMICIAPLHGKRYNEAHTIAWLEMNRLLGVKHFTFYNYSIDPSLDRLFRYYKEQGAVTIRNWPPGSVPIGELGTFPPIKDKLHYFGQLEANNDCLYRWTNRYQYIMFIDLDELFIPYKHATIPELLLAEDRRMDRYGEFIVYMSYLPKRFEKESTTRDHPLVKEDHIVFLERTTLEDRVVYSEKQKFIALGRLTKTVSVHNVEQFWGGRRINFLGINKARLFHYTEPPTQYKKILRGIRDERIQTFFPALINATTSVLGKIRSRGS